MRSIVEETGSIFNEIHQENDVGIDVIIEIFNDGKPINKLVAFQVKSGASYYDKKNDLCLIPVDDHYDYWINYSIPVFGLVYIPSLKQGYWVNIKSYLKKQGKVNVIKFSPKIVNTLTEEYFTNVFSPLVSNELPNITYEDACKLLYSKHDDEITIGVAVLFKKFAYDNKSWDSLIDFFRKSDAKMIPAILIYYLAHIPWHPDIFYSNESYTDASKEYAKKIIETFSKEDILKLISFIDPENLIARGTPGQSVKAIISIIHDANQKLFEIIQDLSMDVHTRAVAAILYAYNAGPDIDEVRKSFEEDEPWFVHVLIDEILENPNFMPL